LKNKLIAITAVALGLAATSSHAVIIDFNAGTAFPYSEEGFTVTTSAGPSVNFGGCAPACANNGTRNVFIGETGPGVQISAVGGGVFSLLGFDIGELFQGIPSTWSSNIQVTGFLSGGGTFVSSFFLDGVHDGSGGAVDMQTFSPVGFANLTSATFASLSGGGFTLDNVNVVAGATKVPEPGTLALLGLGLAGLLSARRRRPA
jgi:hypothetical protein